MFFTPYTKISNAVHYTPSRDSLQGERELEFHGFSKPQSKFISDMLYGIQATGDTVLTDIARAVDSADKHRNVENRLSRNLHSERLAQSLQDAVINDAKGRFFDGNTLVLKLWSSNAKGHKGEN